MSAKEKVSLDVDQQESKGGTSSGTFSVHQSIWQMNEPIDVDSYEPTVKHETLPIITKVESISDTPKEADVSEKTKASAMSRVCNLLGLDTKWPLKIRKEELRKRIKKVDHGLNLENLRVKTCKSIFISQMPTWFEYVHVKALIQLMSDFDVDTDTYYIDMFKDFKNQKTGECLLRFMENKDCIKLFENLQGIQLKDGPIIVKLDLDHEIAEGRDRNNLTIDERFLRFKVKCEQKNENERDNVQETGSTTTIKMETENEGSNIDFQWIEPVIKTEILDYSPEYEIENNLEVKQETIIQSGSLKTEVSVDPEEPEETNESNNQNVEDFPNSPIVYDHNFFNCKIVHIKNLKGACKKGLYNDVVKSWIRNDVGLDVLYNFRKVLQDDKKTPTGDVILEFSKHREAKKVQKKLNGFVYKGKTLAAAMGIGYEIKPQITVSDLKAFALKRKSLYGSNEDDGQQPAKRARTDAPSSTPDSRSEDTTGYMPPDNRSYEAYGLSTEFMKKLNIRVPLTRTVIVYQLHRDVNEEKCREVFSLAGEVKKVTINPDKSNKQWNKARIEYDHPLEAVQAKSMFHKQKLYNQEMHLEIDTMPGRNPLPKGLSAVGPGLANNGLPLRGLRTIAELRLIHELFVHLGYMDRITNNVDKPMKYTYRKANLPDRPRDTNSSSNKDSSSSSRSRHSSRPPSDNSTSKSSSNTNSSLSSKSSNANTCKDTKTKSQDSESSESSLIAIQALGTILVTQGLIPSTTNCDSVHNILGALQKSAIENRRANEQSSNSNANVNVHASNIGVPTPNPTNTNILLKKTDALNQAINQVMQFMPPNTATNVQPNLQQNFQNFTPGIPNVPVQNMNINAPLNNPAPYGIPASRFDVGPTGNPAPQGPLLPAPQGPLLPAPVRLLLPAPVRAPFLPNTNPGPAPLLPSQQIRPRAMAEMLQNFPQNTPIPPVPSYDQNKMARTNLIEVPLPSQPQSKNVQKPVDKVPAASSYLKEKYLSEKESNQSFKKTEMLVFKNLPSSVSTDALTAKMAEIGELKFCSSTGNGRAFVRFQRQTDAERCIRLFHRSKVDGQVIDVSFV